MQVFKKIGTIRSSAILTNSYVAATVIQDVNSFNQLVFYCYFTLGNLTSLELKIESSLDDGTNYVQETNLTVSGGTGTLNKGIYSTTETGNFKIALPMTAQHVKISAKGTGTLTNSLLQIDAAVACV